MTAAAVRLLPVDAARRGPLARRGGAADSPSSPTRDGPADPRAAARPGSRPRSSCARSPTPRGKGGSLPPERALRIGIGGPVGSGKSSLVAALCRALGDELAHRRRHERHLHDRGRALPAPHRRAAARADPRRRDGRLPAHGDPRRRLREPRGGRRARAERRAARPRAGRERRRQPDRDLQPGARRRADLRDRRRGRRRHPAQGRAGDHAQRPARRSTRRISPSSSAPTSTGCAPTRATSAARGRCSSSRSGSTRWRGPVADVGARAGRLFRAGELPSRPSCRRTTTTRPRPRSPRTDGLAHAGRLRLRVERRRRTVGASSRRRPRPVRGAARARPRRDGRASCSCRRSPGRSRATASRSTSRSARAPRSRSSANAATLALPGRHAPAHHRGAGAARHAGARLAWLPEPLILAAGCDLDASLELSSSRRVRRHCHARARRARPPRRGARAATTRELRCELDGAPLLHDALRDQGAAHRRRSSTALAPFGSLALLGLEPPVAALPGVLALAGPGAVARGLAPDAASLRSRLAPVEAAWLATLRRGAPDDPPARSGC